MIKRFTKRPRRTLLGSSIALCGAALSMTAQGAVQDQYAFLFSAKPGKSLAETYRLNHDAAGIPLALDQHLQSVDATLMARIAEALPERRDLRNEPRNLVSQENSAVVHLTKPATVTVTFLHEGTDRRNSFGYFAYPEGSPPKHQSEVQHVIILPNASYADSGGSAAGMRTGHRVALGEFPAGTRIGFFIISDGYGDSVGVKTENAHFYSLSTLNPESTGNLRPHMVLFKDGWDQRLVLGMEDTNRDKDGNSDHDFNDLLFAVESDQVAAIDSDAVVELNPAQGNDLDQDGIVDNLDDYPDDPQLSTRVTYPNDQGRAQLSFEDLWPVEGDYDLNDLVLAYTLDEGRNAAGAIGEIEGHFRIKARGSAYAHGFGINFPGLPADALASASVWVDDQPGVPLGSEPGQTSLTLILATDTKQIAGKNAGTRTCYTAKFNADRNCTEDQGPTIHFKARFTAPVARAALGSAPYNPFIYIVGDRLRETHLPNHPPTAKNKHWLFGWSNEGSNPAIGRYYKTKDRGLPWAVNLPDEWQQPYEKQQVHTCYPSFVDWVNSGGTQALDWYETPVAGCVFPAK